MKDNRSAFSRVLNSDIGKQMFTSIPFLVSQLSFLLFVQAIIIYLWGTASKSIHASLISLICALIYFLFYIYIKRNSITKFYTIFIFVILIVFFLVELLLIILFHISYLWVFLIMTQILSGYFLLNNRYFYLMMSILVLVYAYYFNIEVIDNFRLESFLAVLFAFVISLIMHRDRRSSLLNLEKINSSQNEIYHRFSQLEENINQIFILCSSDFLDFYYISSGFERMFSTSKDLLISQPDIWMDFIHQGDRQRVELELNAAKVEKITRDFDFRTSYNDENKWLKFKLFPIVSKNQAIKDRYAIIIDNISEYKNAELKLAEAKSLEAEFAARIQKNLLFSNPILNIHELDIAAESIPSLSVGGDFFDFYRFSDQIVDIIIADVMGKGIIASMLGAASKSAFMKSRLDLTVLENNIPEIEQIMTLTNRSLSPELMKMSKFITMQYARLNMKNSLFSFIDSGHTSLFYYCSRQKCSWSLKGWNMPIGFNPDETLIRSIIPFEDNDLFFFYSDGITEAENETGEQFGERRLNYILDNSAHLTSNQIVNKIRNLVFHYSSSSGFADDVTSIAMKTGTLNQKYLREEHIFRGIRESLKNIRIFTDKFLKKNCPDYDNELIDSIVLAVNEAAANIIEHNYEKDPELNGREILIEAGKNDAVCFFQLYYDGEEFDWTTSEAPRLNEFKSGGYGLFLMKEIMDSLCYSTNIDGVQCVTLVKYL